MTMSIYHEYLPQEFSLTHIVIQNKCFVIKYILKVNPDHGQVHSQVNPNQKKLKLLFFPSTLPELDDIEFKLK